MGRSLAERAQRVHLLGLEDQALLAEDVLAGQQGVAGDREMLVERRGDHHRVDVLARQQLAVVLVALGLVPAAWMPLFRLGS